MKPDEAVTPSGCSVQCAYPARAMTPKTPEFRTGSRSGPLGRVLALCSVLAIQLLSGCAVTAGGLYDPNRDPLSSEHRIQHTAWLARVEALDANPADKRVLEDSLTLDLLGYLESADYFRSVRILSGQVPPDDYVLRFRFARFRQTWIMHPLYFPAVVATLGIYQFAGGPVFRETSRLSATLAITHADGSSLVVVHSDIDKGENLSMYWRTTGRCGTVDARTSVVRDLMEKAIAELHR